MQEVSPDIDFAAHGKSLGAISEKVSSLADLERALKKAKGNTRTTFIVIDTDPMKTTDAGGHWWDVAIPEVSTREPGARRTQELRQGESQTTHRQLKERSRPMTIRIGANPIGWSNDDMQEIGGWIPLEQCLSEAKAAGFQGMELGNKFPSVATKLRPILDAHGLVLVGGWYSTFLLEHDAETEFAKSTDHRKLLKAMGTNVFIVAECTNTVHGNKTAPLSTPPGDDRSPVENLHDAPHQTCRTAESRRLPACLSPPHGNRGADRR